MIRFCENANCFKVLLKYQVRCCSWKCHREWKKQNNISNPWSGYKGKTFEERYGAEKAKIIKDKSSKSLKNVIKSEQWKANIREGSIKYRQMHQGNSTNVGLYEIDLLNIQEKFDHCIIQRQFHIKGLGYFVDGYCKETNTVYEVYEKRHFTDIKKIQRDLIRQNQIEKKLKCNFVIIKDCFERKKLMSTNITGYSKEDIILLLQRIMKETEENRIMAMKLYNHMETAMMGNKGDLVVLSQMADKWLEQATRQADILVKLAQVMQKLRQTEDEANKDSEGNQKKTDYTKILQELDLIQKNPFDRKIKTRDKEVITLSDFSVAAPANQPDQIIETPKVEISKSINQGDIELETDL